jgi:hypothetical protein
MLQTPPPTPPLEGRGADSARGHSPPFKGRGADSAGGHSPPFKGRGQGWGLYCYSSCLLSFVQIVCCKSTQEQGTDKTNGREKVRQKVRQRHLKHRCLYCVSQSHSDGYAIRSIFVLSSRQTLSHRLLHRRTSDAYVAAWCSVSD